MVLCEHELHMCHRAACRNVRMHDLDAGMVVEVDIELPGSNKGKALLEDERHMRVLVGLSITFFIIITCVAWMDCTMSRAVLFEFNAVSVGPGR